MLTREEFAAAQADAARRIRAAGIAITEAEERSVEVADFGLSRLRDEGAQILTLVSTQRLAAKVIVLLPNHTLPEHWHPPMGADPGKEETVRAVAGAPRLYLPGADSLREGFIPAGKEAAYTCRRECLLRPGEQMTLAPGTKHWLQAGPGGAVLFSFSTPARDILDLFSDPAVRRVTQVAPY